MPKKAKKPERVSKEFWDAMPEFMRKDVEKQHQESYALFDMLAKEAKPMMDLPANVSIKRALNGAMFFIRESTSDNFYGTGLEAALFLLANHGTQAQIREALDLLRRSYLGAEGNSFHTAPTMGQKKFFVEISIWHRNCHDRLKKYLKEED